MMHISKGDFFTEEEKEMNREMILAVSDGCIETMPIYKSRNHDFSSGILDSFCKRLGLPEQ